MKKLWSLSLIICRTSFHTDVLRLVTQYTLSSRMNVTAQLKYFGCVYVLLGQHLSIACFPSCIKHQTGVGGQLLLIKIHYYLYIKQLYQTSYYITKSSSHLKLQ